MSDGKYVTSSSWAVIGWLYIDYLTPTDMELLPPITYKSNQNQLFTVGVIKKSEKYWSQNNDILSKSGTDIFLIIEKY